MSIECNNTTPFASRFDSTALTPASAIFTEITDFGSFIDQSDPLQFVDRASVISITTSLNRILPQVDLSDFPTLQKKIEVFPITFTEVADYVLANSIDTAIIQEQLAQFNPPGFNNTLNGFLDGFDFHLDLNIGKSLSDGTCGAFLDIITTISGIFSMIDSAKKTLSDIQSFLQDLDPQKLIDSLKSKLTLEALQEAIKKAIDKIVAKVRKKIDEALSKIKAQLFNLPCASKHLIKSLGDKVRKAKEFFSKENIKKFKARVEEFIATQIGQFERVSFETLGLLMYKLCQFTELLHELLFGPSKDLLKAAEVIAVEVKVLKSVGNTSTLLAVKNGAIRKDFDQCLIDKEKVTKKINDSAETDAVIDNKCPSKEEIELLMDISDDGIGSIIKFADRVVENREWQKIDMSVWLKLIRLQKLAEDSTTVITVNQGFRKQKGKDAEKGSRSKFAHKTPYAIDIEVPSKFKLRAGTEVARLEQNDDDPTNDEGQTGQNAVLDEDGRPIAGFFEVVVTASRSNIEEYLNSREALAVAASKVGFKGLGMYRSYMHVDMGARRSWIAGQGGIESKITGEEKLDGEDRTRLELIESIHESDSWRQDKMRPSKDALKSRVEGRNYQEVIVPEREVEVDGLVITSKRGKLDAKGIEREIKVKIKPFEAIEVVVAGDDQVSLTADELLERAIDAIPEPTTYKEDNGLSPAEVEKLVDQTPGGADVSRNSDEYTTSHTYTDEQLAEVNRLVGLIPD